MFRVVSAGCAARHDAPGLLLVGLRPTGVDEDAVRRVLKVSSGKRDEFGPAEGAGEAHDEECLFTKSRSRARVPKEHGSDHLVGDRRIAVGLSRGAADAGEERGR
jgi:hypothetical protein